MVRNTCLNCQNRKPNCHSYCESYKEFREKLAKEREAERDEEYYAFGSRWSRGSLIEKSHKQKIRK